MVVQLIRGTGQKRRLESTLGAGAGVAVAGFACGWVGSFRFLGEPGLTLIVAVSAAVALLVGMVNWPDRVLAPMGIALAALAGPLAALLFSSVSVVPAAILGLLVGAVITSFRRLRTLAGPARTLPGMAAAALAPILSLGALVYFVEKMLMH